jgi:hypothetical protein
VAGVAGTGSVVSVLDVLAWEVRVPILPALAWVLMVAGLGLAFGSWVQRATDSRRFRRIAESVRAERVER